LTQLDTPRWQCLRSRDLPHILAALLRGGHRHGEKDDGRSGTDVMARTGNRRRFIAALGGVPIALAGSRWLGPEAAATDYAATPGVPADQGLQMLMDGNKRFVAGALTSFNDLAQRRDELATGQSPFAVIVCCSDSRVPPEIVFDQTLGQLFVVRTAGQVIDEAARGSIAYGVDFLKAPLLLVLGHSGCGAVEAAIAALQGATIPGYAYRFAEGIGPAVQSVLDEPGDQLDNAIRANIQMGVDQLRTAEPDLAAAVSSGQLTVAGGHYDLASGEVTFL
jgi:carbonic anhydrase